MRAQVISDLHTEFYYGAPSGFLSTLPFADDLDFLILAGDIVASYQDVNQMHGVFDFLSKKARWVIYITGNHEYYGSSFKKAHQLLLSVMPRNFHWLRNNLVEVEGVRFFGGTMWFGNPDQLNTFYKRDMNDFHEIEDLRNDGGYSVYVENDDFTHKAEGFIDKDTVVVTHHLPSNQSIAPQYKTSPLNRFFVSDQTKIIEEKQPRLWVHGHTHNSFDYSLGATRVVCNPYGYPSQRKFFRTCPPVTVEL